MGKQLLPRLSCASRSLRAGCIAPVLPLEEVRLAHSLGVGACLIAPLVVRKFVVA